ncbi:hypothetical protein EDB89DRAFT_1905720 [Lactarius sanguifluus]|nr:hypothetical protein EDB89DRAFT_1905720 [Lactarius sanguifluus]
MNYKLRESTLRKEGELASRGAGEALYGAMDSKDKGKNRSESRVKQNKTREDVIHGGETETATSWMPVPAVGPNFELGHTSMKQRGENTPSITESRAWVDIQASRTQESGWHMDETIRTERGVWSRVRRYRGAESGAFAMARAGANANGRKQEQAWMGEMRDETRCRPRRQDEATTNDLSRSARAAGLTRTEITLREKGKHKARLIFMSQ